MQPIPIDEIVFCHTHKQFNLSHVTIQIAVTRADFTRTSVTVPSVTGQSNSIPTNFLLSAPKCTGSVLEEELGSILSYMLTDYNSASDPIADIKVVVYYTREVSVLVLY